VTDAAGYISLPEHYLLVSLADCATFRTWVNASGDDAQAQARARIHDTALPPSSTGEPYTLAELQRFRPFAIIDTMQARRFAKEATRAMLGTTGVLLLILEQDVPEPIQNDPAEIGRRFKNAVGKIANELLAQAEDDGKLDIQAVDYTEPYYRTEEDVHETFGDVVCAQLFIEHEGQ